MMSIRSMTGVIATTFTFLSGAAQAAPLHRLVATYAAPEMGLLALFAGAGAVLFLTRRRTPSA